MNAKQRAQRAGVAVAASLLVAVMAAGSAGCDFLKPKPKKAFAEACSLDSDCESLDCAGQSGVCSKACTYNTDCGGALVCRQKDDGSGDHCAKPVGQALNGSCMDPGDCENGHCLKRVGEDSSPGICSRFCVASADCPDGMKICDTISDTGVFKMCLPGSVGAPVAKFGTVPRKVTTTTPQAATTTAPPVPAPVVNGRGVVLAPRSATPVATATAAPTATATTTTTAKAPVKIKPRK